MTADRLALATRTKRARRTSTCPTCRGAILPGMTIARFASPLARIHVRCVPAVARVTGPHSDAETSAHPRAAARKEDPP